MPRPQPGDYAEYYGQYVTQTPDGDITTLLETQIESAVAFFQGIAEKSALRYAPDKWSIAEVLAHVIDTERVFAYRAMVFARGDTARLPGFDQESYIRNFDSGSIPFSDLVDEFVHHRRACVAMFRGFDEAAWKRTGNASDCDFTVLSIPYIIVGHLNHHIAVIKERYL